MQKTIKERTIFSRDNLEVLRGIDSNTIDLIYLDPPFNKKKVFTLPIGSTSQGGSFSDIFGKERIKDEWLGLIAESNPKVEQLIQAAGVIGNKSNKYYLCFMAIRLIEMHRILKDTGSIYLHCDDTMSHYLKLMLDCIFGEGNRKNEIVWRRTSAHSNAMRFGRIHDCIFYYAKSENFTFNKILLPYTAKQLEMYSHEDDKGKYASDNLTGLGVNHNDIGWRGYHPSEKGKGNHWTVPKDKIIDLVGEEQAQALSTIEKLELLEKEGYIYWSENGVPRYKRYLHDMEGALPQDIWTDVKPVRKRKYPTQKPVKLLERIILASTNEGDVVLDPFCGCATTCIAAERLNRKWIGIDVSDVAYDLVRQRLEEEANVTSHDPKHVAKTLSFAKVYLRTDIPELTDTQHEPITIGGKHKLYGQQEGFCKGCNIHFNFQNLTIDHIVPQSQGGGDSPENLQLLCNSCNSIKGDRTMEFLIVRLKELKRIE